MQSLSDKSFLSALQTRVADVISHLTVDTSDAQAYLLPLYSSPIIDGTAALILFNEWRASQQQALASSMLPITLPPEWVGGAKEGYALPQPTLPPMVRSLWQSGLLALLKHQSDSLAILRAAIRHLHQLGSPFWDAWVQVMDELLYQAKNTGVSLGLRHCLINFNRLLYQASGSSPLCSLFVQELWCNVAFYAGVYPEHPLSLNDKGAEALHQRIQMHAQRIANALVVNPDDKTEKMRMQAWENDLLLLQDGLLFSGNTTAYQNIEHRMQACKNYMPKISIPVQKLWAECIKLAVAR